MTVCIYTANFGSYDKPRPQVAQDIEVDWLYFADRQTRASIPQPWAMTVLPRHVPRTPMMTAKWWKTHPPTGYDHVIWIDASMEVTAPTFAREAISALEERSFAVWKHPRRDDVLDEIAASLGAESQDGKYRDVAQAMVRQGNAYRSLGLPNPSGLYACGTIVWTPAARDVGIAWWHECERWSFQDQVSLPFVCWALGVRPSIFPFGQIDKCLSRGAPYLANRWLRIWPHE